MSQQNQQPNQNPTPEQIYQKFNNNELNSRQMFEILYNSFIKLEQEYTKEKSINAQLIEQLNQFTKQKSATTPSTDDSKIIKQKDKGKK